MGVAYAFSNRGASQCTSSVMLSRGSINNCRINIGMKSLAVDEKGGALYLLTSQRVQK